MSSQLRAVLEDIPVLSIKTGMLTDGPTIESIVRVLSETTAAKRPHLVVDPVMVSTSGHRLLESSAITIVRTKLLPLADLMTPNIQEAEVLLDSIPNNSPRKLASVADMRRAAQELSLQCGVPNVLVKGGHLTLSALDIDIAPDDDSINTSITEYAGTCDPAYPAILSAALGHDHAADGLVVDVLFTRTVESGVEGRFILFVRPRLNTKSTHGTGCTLSAAITCELALGRSGKRFVLNKIQRR